MENYDRIIELMNYYCVLKCGIIEKRNRGVNADEISCGSSSRSG